jgi:hypothetical protein
MKAKLGSKAAITVTAHNLAKIFYTLITPNKASTTSPSGPLMTRRTVNARRTSYNAKQPGWAFHSFR